LCHIVLQTGGEIELDKVQVEIQDVSRNDLGDIENEVTAYVQAVARIDAEEHACSFLFFSFFLYVLKLLTLSMTIHDDGLASKVDGVVGGVVPDDETPNFSKVQ